LCRFGEHSLGLARDKRIIDIGVILVLIDWLAIAILCLGMIANLDALREAIEAVALNGGSVGAARLHIARRCDGSLRTFDP